jgi:hypothetical protein
MYDTSLLIFSLDNISISRDKVPQVKLIIDQSIMNMKNKLNLKCMHLLKCHHYVLNLMMMIVILMNPKHFHLLFLLVRNSFLKKFFISLFYSGDILSCQPNLYNCTAPLTSKSSSRASAKSSTVSSNRRHEKIYTRTLNLLNTRQCTIPFELSISDPSFLSIQPSVLTTLTPQSKVNIQCNFHLSQDIIDRFNTKNLNKNPALLANIDQTTTIEHGRRIHWREQLAVKFKQNEMEQIIPIDIRLYFPILTVNCEKIDFGTCFLDQTRQKEFIIKNLTCSSSAWSIRKGNSLSNSC